MFILNQDRNGSLNVDIIDQIVAVAPRSNDKDRRHLVVALVGNREEILGRYPTMDDCKRAVDFVTFLINNKSAVISMPKNSDIRNLEDRIVKKFQFVEVKSSRRGGGQ